MVTVIGPRLCICSLNRGNTEPDELSTFPNLTIEHMMLEFDFVAKSCKTSSATRLVAPIALVGRTALSVEINIKRSTPLFSAAETALDVPNTLFSMPWRMLRSTNGTCLYAAA